ncbi:tellurite resistance/C4-dicarboxylate transporter family protein [Nocardia yamanashiensis]|uniref:tellurite resistance/C4-dicarboxylate transporter family protein n=1 Tax=Nocardia yamanashiensis TaxID=209247 RepID=UPI001E4DD535|nr:tellurite resistance/C4-dicarboxylate transporter family protein [Nocardia yamanashiensis]UGT43380.1 tellurite resistance/C4-dicarboxylate transporter family protein [Nocardia yamanashiensis]
MTDRAAAWWRELPPAAGAAVMATGILSIGLHLTGFEVLSVAALALAAVVWVVLGIDFATRLVGQPSRWVAEAGTPPGLTGVAATTVLGTRVVLLGWDGLGAAALVLAGIWWPVLLVAVMRRWSRVMPGSEFLVCVATQGLAVLAASLAGAGGPVWLCRAALAWLCLGVLLYLIALTHFDFRQIWQGAGDQWVCTGALAISALAAAKILAVHWLSGAGHTVLLGALWVLLGLNWVLYLVLGIAEIARPRREYDIRRWATVFPLGMTAVATLTAGTVTGVSVSGAVGRLLLAIAVAAWILTLVKGLRGRLR